MKNSVYPNEELKRIIEEHEKEFNEPIKKIAKAILKDMPKLMKRSITVKDEKIRKENR